MLPLSSSLERKPPNKEKGGGEAHDYITLALCLKNLFAPMRLGKNQMKKEKENIENLITS